MDEQRRLSLDDLEPDRIVLTFQGVDYELPGALPMPVLVRLCRFQEKLEAAGDDMGKLADAIESVLDDVMGLIRVYQPDTPTLNFSIEALLEVVTFLVAGQRVEETVRESQDQGAETSAAGTAEAAPLARAS